MNELNILKDCKQIVWDILELCKYKPQWKYTINPQIIRACLSIGSNIAEGNCRSRKEFNRFLDIAIGSATETIFQLEFYDNTEEIEDRINKVIAVCKKLKSRNSSIVPR